MKWTGPETDKFMDLVLEGNDPNGLALFFGVSPEKVKAQYRRAFYPDKPYMPSGQRKSRVGIKLTELERKLIHKHLSQGMPTAHIAKMLARKPNEICPDYNGKITFEQMKTISPVTDQLLVHHYLYHISKNPIITDQAYDDAKAEEIEFGGGGGWLKLIAGSKKQVCDYPAHIRSLAYYMLYKFMEATGEWNDGKLPYDWKK
jgi:hypothetical protein